MKASLVLLTYNELNTGTKPCVNSIYEHTNFDDFELIIIDNNSSDGTQNYLKELQNKYSNIKLKLNKKNRGFAGGMNDGIKLASGEFIILLNNDILMSPDWLNKILVPFKKDINIGMVGPMSNNVGTEQCILIENLTKDNFISLTNAYTKKYKEHYYFTERLCFFCVAIKREVINKVGLLDEKFGIGLYEDDDYCQRVLKSGYQIAGTEGCFIYHLGSLTFDKANRDHGERNKRHLETKHGIKWTTTNIGINYLKKIKEDLYNHKEKNKIIDSDLEKVYMRLESFDSFMHALRDYELTLLKKAKPTMIERIKRIISLPERFIRKNILKK